MRILRLMGRIFALSLQREMAFRTDLIFSLLMSIIDVAAGVLALAAVFGRVQALAGWRLEEALVLLGCFEIVTGLLNTFIEPNLAWFTEKVTGGRLDDVLLQPLPSLFMASLGSCRPLALRQVLLGAAVLAFGVAKAAHVLTPGGVLAFLVLILAGVAVTWATRLLTATAAFFAPGMEPSVLYSAAWQLGRYPVSIYHPMVARLLTYVVPAALVATLPAAALTRGATPGLLAVGLGMGVGAIAVAVFAWNAGIRRYTGATS